MEFRDRIRELRRVPASALKPNPRNWRTHPANQVAAIEAVLDEVGFAGAVLARELDDGSLELIDGHARAGVAGDQQVPVLVLDVNEDEANTILATFDPIGAMAEADAEMLRQVVDAANIESSALADIVAGLIGDDVPVPRDAESPDDFKEVDETIETDYTCPKCNYKWSGGV